MDHGYAGVAELADAVALGATGLTSLEVQILSSACCLYEILRKPAKTSIIIDDFSLLSEVRWSKLCPIEEEKMCQNVPEGRLKKLVPERGFEPPWT
jgi:hypothetical protein